MEMYAREGQGSCGEDGRGKQGEAAAVRLVVPLDEWF